MSDWNDIRLIAVIAKTGSFTAAAAILGTSKPTISRQVAALEARAGVPLFARTSHGASLTAEGLLLLQKAISIEELVNDFDLSLRLLRRERDRIVTVQLSEGAAHYLLTPAISGHEVGPLGVAAYSLRLQLPAMRLLMPDNPEPPDIALKWLPVGTTPTGSSTARVRKLADISFIPLYGEKYGTQHRTPVKFDDLKNHSLVTLKAYDWFKADPNWEPWHRMTANSPKITTTNSSSSVGILTLSGSGISLLPSYSTMYFEQFKILDVPTPPMRSELWMIAEAETYQHPAVRKCYQELGRAFRAADWRNP